MSNKREKTIRKEIRRRLSGISEEKSVLEREIINDWLSMSISNRISLAFRILKWKRK